MSESINLHILVILPQQWKTIYTIGDAYTQALTINKTVSMLLKKTAVMQGLLCRYPENHKKKKINSTKG